MTRTINGAVENVLSCIHFHKFKPSWYPFSHIFTKFLEKDIKGKWALVKNKILLNVYR